MKSALLRASLRVSALSLLIAGSAAPAQFQLPNLGGGQGIGQGIGLGSGQGGGGLLGLLLPNVVSVAAPNAAGVLGYCVKNKFLGAPGAASVIGQLTGRAGTKAEPGYAAGRKGLLQMDGNSLPLGDLKAQATTKVCDLVLKHARSLL
ncbi:MAG TPA: DUF2501 domain-containing protein [Sphingobium sp.]